MLLGEVEDCAVVEAVIDDDVSISDSVDDFGVKEVRVILL